jgi:sulfur carrier protein ThiS
LSVRVRLTGMLKDYQAGAAEVAVPAGLTVLEALQTLGIPSVVVALVLVNGEARGKDTILEEGDEVQLLAVIGGG